MNRVNLAVPYSQKDEAKAMGARWDQELRTWWATVDQCDAHKGLLRWSAGAHEVNRQPVRRTQAKSQNGSKPVRTEQRLFTLAACGCKRVAPWDDCEHTVRVVAVKTTQDLADWR